MAPPDWVFTDSCDRAGTGERFERFVSHMCRAFTDPGHFQVCVASSDGGFLGDGESPWALVPVVDSPFDTPWRRGVEDGQMLLPGCDGAVRCSEGAVSVGRQARASGMAEGSFRVFSGRLPTDGFASDPVSRDEACKTAAHAWSAAEGGELCAGLPETPPSGAASV